MPDVGTGTRLPSPLAATVLETMGQDCGPVEAEPYASWAKGLAGELLPLQESVREPVGASVPDRIAAQAPSTSHVAAGADEAEAHPSDHGDAEVGVVDTDADGLYSHGVERATNLKTEGDGDQLGCESPRSTRAYSRSVRVSPPDGGSADAGSEAAEALRQSRLSRWQEQRG